MPTVAAKPAGPKYSEIVKEVSARTRGWSGTRALMLLLPSYV